MAGTFLAELQERNASQHPSPMKEEGLALVENGEEKQLICQGRLPHGQSGEWITLEWEPLGSGT